MGGAGAGQAGHHSDERGRQAGRPPPQCCPVHMYITCPSQPSACLFSVCLLPAYKASLLPALAFSRKMEALLLLYIHIHANF